MSSLRGSYALLHFLSYWKPVLLHSSLRGRSISWFRGMKESEIVSQVSDLRVTLA